VDGELVYVLTPHGDLVCCEAATGSERWRKNLKADFDGVKADNWGYSESVLIDGDQLVCTPGGQQSLMVALDKLTGDLKWKAVHEGDRGAGHASIVISEIGGTKVYVQCTGSGPIGVRARDGQWLWSYPIEKTTAVIPTPIVRGDLVFFYHASADPTARLARWILHTGYSVPSRPRPSGAVAFVAPAPASAPPPLGNR
jgi:outer membrane protein assembly factor BamB